MRKIHLGLSLLLTSAFLPSLQADPAVLVTDLDRREDARFSARPEPIQVYRDELYFWSDDPLTGTELWKSDGTSPGTRRVKDICPGRCSARPSVGSESTVFGESTVFDESTVLGDRLFFTACDGARGCQLWKTDGSGSGTGIVESFIVPDIAEDFFSPTDLTAWNGHLYLAAHDPEFGYEPFRSDGTPEGTVLLRDLEPGDASSLLGLSATENHLFLHVSDGLWTSDGTAGGTERVATLPMHRGVTPATLGGLLVFATEDGVWRSDGSAAGTFRLWEQPRQGGVG